MPEYSDKRLSFLIHSTLDNFGFKKENILLRSKMVNDEAETTDGIVQKTFKSVAAGSSAEGVGLAKSDLDVMYVLHDAVCVDKGYVDTHCVVLETDYTSTAPGYTKVVALPIPDTLGISGFFKAICSGECKLNKTYISSGKVKLYHSALGKLFHNFDLATNGPALTLTGQSHAYIEADFVMSVYFYGGIFLENWAKRSRLHSWPPVEIVKKVSEMEGYIVPVGDKQSERPNLEWRICYTTAEKELVLNLSDSQMKVYVILKMIAKDLLKPVCKELTSYVMKNVVFWIAERSHPHQFSIYNLVNAIQSALNLIKYCIQNNHLPNYMIPERNLLKGAVYGHKKQEVLNFLSKCLEEGGTIILRIPKLYTCISLRVSHPDNVLMFGKWRDSVEQIVDLYARQLFRNFSLQLPMDLNLDGGTAAEIINNYTIEKSQDPKCFGTMISMMSLVVPDWISLCLSGMPFENIAKIVGDRMELLDIL